MSGLRLRELEQRRFDAISESVTFAIVGTIVIVLYLVGVL